MPLSKVLEIYWTYTEDDIRAKLKIKLGFIKASSYESLQSLAYVVSSALGGKKEDIRPVSSAHEAMSSLSSIFGGNIKVN